MGQYSPMVTWGVMGAPNLIHRSVIPWIQVLQIQGVLPIFISSPPSHNIGCPRLYHQTLTHKNYNDELETRKHVFLEREPHPLDLTKWIHIYFWVNSIGATLVSDEELSQLSLFKPSKSKYGLKLGLKELIQKFQWKTEQQQEIIKEFVVSFFLGTLVLLWQKCTQTFSSVIV